MKRRSRVLRAAGPVAAAVAICAALVPTVAVAQEPEHPLQDKFANRYTVGSAPPPSGSLDFRDLDLGTLITECPQAGLEGDPLHPQPLDRRQKDKVE